jgi:hypothetical protein
VEGKDASLGSIAHVSIKYDHNLKKTDDYDA